MFRKTMHERKRKKKKRKCKIVKQNNFFKLMKTAQHRW